MDIRKQEVRTGVTQLRRRLVTILTKLKQDLAVDVVTFLLYDADADEFDLPIGLGLRDEASFTASTPFPGNDRAVLRIVRDGQPVYVADARSDPRIDGAFVRRERILSTAGFPVALDNAPVGVLFVSSRRGHDVSGIDKGAVEDAIRDAAEVITLSSEVLLALRELRSQSTGQSERSIQSILRVACSVMKTPITLWLLDPDGTTLRIRAHTDAPIDYIHQAVATVDDGSLVSLAVSTGEAQTTQDLENNPRFHYPKAARECGWRSCWVVPFQSRGRTVGVIEVFGFDTRELKPQQTNWLRGLAELVGSSIAFDFITKEAETLADVSRELSKYPGFEQALQIIVDGARDLTQANASTLFLFDPKEDRFSVGAHSSDRDGTPSIRQLPREHGLTRRIIETRKPAFISDTVGVDLADKALSLKQASLIGVPLETEGEVMAVLYVSGYRKSQFVQKDIDLLVALASQTSAALAQTRHLMRAVEAIDRADSGLFRREKVLEKICREVEERFRFDYVAVQLIRPWERIIETVHGTGAASKWLGLAKHLLVDDPDLRDTQADVVLSDPPRIEILAGWDRRADEWIYHRFDHAHYARLCVPIVLVRDQSGKILADRADDWEAQPRSDEDQDGKGHRRTIEVQVPKRYRGEVKLEIIGTLCGGRHDPNAGYLQLKDRISDEEAVDLFKFVALRASAVHRTTLPHVLETVVEYARTMVGADTANLDFSPLEKGDRRYTLEFRAGSLFRDFESRYPWAQQLGAQAIEEQRPVWIHNPSGGEDERDFEGKYPDAFSAGYGAAAAFPLLVEEDIQGVLHIYFQKTHRFSLDEIEWVGIFAQRAVDAIRYAINYTQLRDDAGVLENLHRIADSLVSRPEAKDLLQRIAGSARNILAADVVTLYDYIEPEKRFRGRPDISGRLKTEWKEIMMIGRQAPASLLIDHGKNIYARESVDNPILNKQVNDRKGEQNPPSVAREGIRSTAGILLRLGKEVLGVMFVNYRRPHRFLKQEKEILDIMATAAATAIKNQRLLSTLGEVDREIITTLSLERLLELVVQCAAQITASDVVDLRRLESPVSDGLVVVSRYPKDRRFNSEWRRIQVGRGVTGWVAEHKKPALVRDTDNERCYKNYFPGVRSELSVPLLDAESQLHGVLTVGSDRREAFAASDQRMLEGLASRAVIAIQNADQQRRLTDIQTIKRFGDLAGPFLDRIDKNIGVILDQATRLLDRISGPSRETVQEICGLARPILRDARNLHEWASEGSQSVALDRAVSEALDQVRRTLSIRVDGLETLDGLPLVEAGARQLTDLFVNLVQNAVDAMPNGGTLSIFGHAERNRPWISIQVRDTGCGIDSGQLDSVFKRGYSTKQTEKGLGFGLWWARGYIESLGGYIGVESPAGGWKTIFTLVLPTIQQGKH